MAASGFLEPLDEKVAREIGSLEGVTTVHCLLFHPLMPYPIISEWQEIRQGKKLLSDSVTRICGPLIRLSQRLSSDFEAFDDEDAAPVPGTDSFDAAF